MTKRKRTPTAKAVEQVTWLSRKRKVLGSIVLARDPVECSIINELLQLQIQNARLKAYVEKSGVWAEMKEVVTWKPFDFLHYFCVLFQRKYRKEYRVSGNIVHNYQRIETFMAVNKIDNEKYKSFIDLAFSRYFTNMLVPNLGHIVNAFLYNKLCGDNVSRTTTQDWFDLDQTIQRENAEFENLSDTSFEFNFIDDKLIKENSCIQEALRTGCL